MHSDTQIPADTQTHAAMQTRRHADTCLLTIVPGISSGRLGTMVHRLRGIEETKTRGHTDTQNDTQTRRHANTQDTQTGTRILANMKIRRHAVTSGHAGIQIRRHADIQIRRHADTQAYRFADIQIRRHTDTQTRRHTQTHADTQTRRHAEGTQTHTDTLTSRYADTRSHKDTQTHAS
jgi:hypothetical protein